MELKRVTRDNASGGGPAARPDAAVLAAVDVTSPDAAYLATRHERQDRAHMARFTERANGMRQLFTLIGPTATTGIRKALSAKTRPKRLLANQQGRGHISDRHRRTEVWIAKTTGTHIPFGPALPRYLLACPLPAGTVEPEGKVHDLGPTTQLSGPRRQLPSPLEKGT